MKAVAAPDRPAGITDDVLTQGPRAATLLAYVREGVDRLVGADPGLQQLRTGLQAVLGIALGAGLVDLFVSVTGGLQLKPGQAPPAVVAAHNHAILIVSMLLAGIVAMLASFQVNEPTMRRQIVSTSWLPLPMIAALVLALVIGRWRVPTLIYLVLLMAGAVYVRRWGPPGFRAGMVAFQGGFLGFFLHTELALRDLGWLVADLYLGAVASVIVRAVLFRPDPARTLARMRRSWDARARRLLALALALLEAEPQRRPGLQERMRRQLIRMNESTLMVDAQLAESVPESAPLEAQRLFDADLSLTSTARFAAALSRLDPPADLRATAVTALTAMRDLRWADAQDAGNALAAVTDDSERRTVVAHRLAAAVEAHVTARQQLADAITDRLEGRVAAEFTPAVTLNAGYLPGSVNVAAAASTTPGRGSLLDRAALPPYLRTTIQVTVAATIAVVAGDLLSGARLYWAVLATFLAFLATTNSGEQVRKAVFRVTGTAIGIVIGDLLVHITGGHVWLSLLFVLISLFFGIYLIRVNYTFMVIGVTITLSQLYVQLGELSWSLLLLRLAETAIGVAAVIITVLLIVPLRPQRVLTTAVHQWFDAASDVLHAALQKLLGTEDGQPLQPLVRQLDAAYAALEATAAPLRRATFGRNSTQLAEIRSVTAAARNYLRSLAVEASLESVPGCRPLEQAAEQLQASVAAITARIESGTSGGYVRVGELLDAARRSVPAHGEAALGLRDLTLLDAAFARLAGALGMDVTELEPSGATSGTV
jgi:uncharacterized membrane protein YgaE (UPF0421/DUF939 family)